MASKSKKKSKLNKSTSTKSLMKSTGARSSRTDRSGVTTVFASNKDVDSGKSIGKFKNTDNGFEAITPDKGAMSSGIDLKGVSVSPMRADTLMSNENKMGLPPKPQGSALPFDMGQINSMLGADKEGGFQQNMQDYFDNLAQIEQPSAEKLQRDLMKETGVNDARKEYNRLTGQLEAITTSSQAQQLALEGQGRGQTSSFVGGEQARIAREAAIQALPVQGQLAAAQGNLELAQQTFNSLYTARLQDAQADYQFKTNIINRVFDYANASETRRLADIQRQEDIALRTKESNINYLRDLSREAIQNGNTNALATLGNIKPDSPTFEQDVARASQMIRKPASGESFLSIAEAEALGVPYGTSRSDAMKLGITPGGANMSGLVTTSTGEKGIKNTDGTVTPLSEINFDDPTQIDNLPVNDITKAVMGGYIKTKELTPTQKGQVASDLQSIQFNPNTYVSKKLDTLVESWSNVPEDSKGVVQGLKFWERWTKPEVANFESNKAILTREIARLNDVGVLSDQDVESYNNAMPSRQDQSLEVVVNKASGIQSSITGKSGGENVGKLIILNDGRTAIVGSDGDTLLDPKTGKKLQ